MVAVVVMHVVKGENHCGLEGTRNLRCAASSGLQASTHDRYQVSGIRNQVSGIRAWQGIRPDS
jgi:hypothetical protein